MIISVLFSTLQLYAQNDWLSKKYYAFHTHNSYELRFNGKGQYIQITNDRKDSKIKGKYQLLGDTVVLYRPSIRNGKKLENREYYIKHGNDCIVLMPWRYGYYTSLEAPIGEKQIDLNYPQLPMKNSPKGDLEKMIQTVIDSIKTESTYDSTMSIKPYYEVNSGNEYSFERFGSKMSFITKEDSTDNYLEINTIGLGVENAVVIIRVHRFSAPYNHLVATFKKINGQWVVDGRINY